ncbi:MAG TPA: ABC transporter permease [Methanospirillum sp.]|nr:ABC transporter permease [Methanospirillum sp.]
MPDQIALSTWILRKMIRYLISIFLILIIVFIVPRSMPGDPVRNLVGEDIWLSPETIQRIRSDMGLDLPLGDQFLHYLHNLTSWDLGYSYHLHAPVLEILLGRIPWTLLLIGTSILAGAGIGVILGARVGWDNEQWWARFLTGSALLVSSVPPYLLGLAFLAIFSFHLRLFPFKGLYDTPDCLSILYHLTLPVLVLTLFYASRNLLIMRGSVISERGLLYPQCVRSLGIPSHAILWRHVAKNALLPVLTLIALDFGFLFSGALFIEIVFSLQGMGSLIYDAILLRDIPILTGSFLMISVLVILANICVDSISAILDPRVRMVQE